MAGRPRTTGARIRYRSPIPAARSRFAPATSDAGRGVPCAVNGRASGSRATGRPFDPFCAGCSSGARSYVGDESRLTATNRSDSEGREQSSAGLDRPCYVLLWVLDAEVTADLPGEMLVDLAMSGHRRPSVLGWIVPPRVSSSLSQAFRNHTIRDVESGHGASYRDF